MDKSTAINKEISDEISAIKSRTTLFDDKLRKLETNFKKEERLDKQSNPRVLYRITKKDKS